MPIIARHLAIFYLGYFALVGVMLPYLNLYFTDIGLSPYQIGIIGAITPLIKIVTPNIWGWLADRRGIRHALIRVACAGALVAFSLLLWTRNFYLIIVVMFLYGAFSSAIVPLVEATALEAVDRFGIDYGRIRLWGSIGFILVSLGLGPVLDRTSSVLVLWSVLLLLAVNLWSVRSFPDAVAPAHAAAGEAGVWRLLSSRPVLVFYGVCLLAQASHGTYYGFYSIYMEHLGYSRSTIGLLWAAGVAAEVVAMLFAGRLLALIGTRDVLRIALLFTVLRWAVLGSVHDPGWLVVAQLLHAATFGLFHVAAVTHVHRLMPESLRATGQSLYSSLSFGLGLTVGLYLSGVFYESAGAALLFTVNAGVAAIATLLALGLSRPEQARAVI